MARVGVILSGCGVQDGSEIHEAVLTLLALDRAGAVAVVAAPDRDQAELAETVDWVFWHDFVHNNIIRDFFVGFARFTSEVLDANGVDGIVNGAGKVARGLANIIRQSQTGFARNYALSVFLGAVALLAYFLLAT
jgi:NADH:ubiquinone oxidoreductase subunit 5 (subunit L)/multisubunit Na+/H+ antiporter MnhA subunit